MLWPETTERGASGELVIAGTTISDLAERFGTPLYVFDAVTLRNRARLYREAFADAYPRSRVVYAGKAYLSPAIVAILHEEGLGLDVVSGGELYAGLLAGVPASEMTFHGNNKTEQELREAVTAGVGYIAVDNDWELSLLSQLTAEIGTTVPVLLRLNPGIEVHTHEKIRTGALDSKFGFPIQTGAAADAVKQALSISGARLAGYHAHIGSQVFDPGAYVTALRTVFDFAAEMRDRYGVAPEVVSPGGGFGIAYEEGQVVPPAQSWAGVIGETVREACARTGLPVPELVVEPGRAIVGPAGVAVYRVGAIKDIPGVRRYVSVDGGMADNIRPALYDARYTAALANRTGMGEMETVTIAGKYCESGDVLIRDVALPRLAPGDLLAVPAVGAYCLAMASNYNLIPRPAAVLVGEGDAHLIRRRETYADLVRADVLPGKGELDRSLAGPALAHSGET